MIVDHNQRCLITCRALFHVNVYYRGILYSYQLNISFSKNVPVLGRQTSCAAPFNLLYNHLNADPFYQKYIDINPPDQHI